MSDIVKGDNNEGDDWKEQLLRSAPPQDDADDSSMSLEGTMNVVRDGMWSLGDAALKSVAEVLVGFGISPTVLGYTEEDLLEEEGEPSDGPLPIQKDEVVAKTSFSLRSEENMNRRKQEEIVQAPEFNPVEEESEGEDDVVTDIAAAVWGTAEELLGDGFGDEKKDK